MTKPEIIYIDNKRAIVPMVWVEPLVKDVDTVGMGLYEISFKDNTPSLKYRCNFAKSHHMIDNDMCLAILEHWEKYNIPPIPENLE